MSECKEVNSKKFDAIKKKSIVLNKCPKCPNLGGDIIIPMVAYGRTSHRVFIRCKYCGYETKTKEIQNGKRFAMDREQIVKALECCTRGRKNKEDRPCLECPYNECNLVGGTSERQVTGTCQGWLMKDALSIIKELTEDVERLENALVEQSAENVMLCGEVKHARADTARKMQERLHERKVSYGNITFRVVPIDDIDQIAKEMIGEDNG